MMKQEKKYPVKKDQKNCQVSTTVIRYSVIAEKRIHVKLQNEIFANFAVVSFVKLCCVEKQYISACNAGFYCTGINLLYCTPVACVHMLHLLPH